MNGLMEIEEIGKCCEEFATGLLDMIEDMRMLIPLLIYKNEVDCLKMIRAVLSSAHSNILEAYTTINL